MRFCLILAALFTFAPVAFAQAPAAKPDTKATLSADELEMMTDSVTQLERAATDMQSARLFMEAASAKQERAQILIEARKLKILNARGYSDKDLPACLRLAAALSADPASNDGTVDYPKACGHEAAAGFACGMSASGGLRQRTGSRLGRA